MAQEQRTNLASLDPDQLAQAKQRIEADIQRFADSMAFLSKSASIFSSANGAIKELSEASEGQQMLLPLTQSLYVSGSVASVDQVLIDVGTGYFVEMSTAEGQDYCKRKVDKLKVNIEGLQEILRVKQSQLIQVEKAYNAKLATLQEQRA